MKFSFLPTIKLPLVDVSTDPLDLVVAGLVLRMKQLSRTSPKFIELSYDRQFRLQIGTDQGMARQIIINNGQVEIISGHAEPADFVIQFRNSDEGVKTLIKGDSSAFMTGVQEGNIKVEGDYSLLMWFTKVSKLIPPKLPKPIKEKVTFLRQLVKSKTGH